MARALILSAILILFSPFCFSMIGGFVKVDPEYKPTVEPEVVVRNMPKARSQDTIGLCYAFTAAGAIDAYNCREKKIDCGALSNDQKSSALDLAKFSREVSEKGFVREQLSTGEQIDTERLAEFRPSYVGLDAEGGGNPLLVVDNAVNRVHQVASEACAPFDQIVNRGRNEEEVEEIQKASWKNLKNTFAAFKRKYLSCGDCASKYFYEEVDKLRTDFRIQVDNKEMLQAFTSDTYSSFLEKLLVPQACADAKKAINFDEDNPPRVRVFSYTQSESKDLKYKKAISKIKDLVSGQTPAIIASYCAAEAMMPSMEACKGSGHTFLIDGYKRVCKSKSVTDCKDVVKVHNSWGDSWQSKMNGGWVDARALLDRTYYEPQSIGWIERPGTSETARK